MTFRPAMEDRTTPPTYHRTPSTKTRKRSVILLLVIGAVLISTSSLSAAVFAADYNSGFENNGVITDGSLSPWTDTRTVSGVVQPIVTEVTVRLTLSGGFNGDLYGYLSYNGVSVPLLNRVGVGTGNSAGYSDSGMSVTFSDEATNNFHFYRSVEDFSISGGAQWQPDGRAISPLSTPASFDAAGTVSLSAFDGMNPNGDWTLVMADVSGGGGQTTVTSWGLTVVPEPAHIGLVFALGLLAVPLTKKWLARTARS